MLCVKIKKFESSKYSSFGDCITINKGHILIFISVNLNIKELTQNSMPWRNSRGNKICSPASIIC